MALHALDSDGADARRRRRHGGLQGAGCSSKEAKEARKTEWQKPCKTLTEYQTPNNFNDLDCKTPNTATLRGVEGVSPLGFVSPFPLGGVGGAHPPLLPSSQKQSRPPCPRRGARFARASS